MLTAWLVAAALSTPAFAAPAPDVVASTSWNEERTLLDLLRDRDPEVRRQAVRALKAWVSQRSSARDRVLEVFKNSSEELLVRREAAKTLSFVTGHSDVYHALLEQAKHGDDVGLRAISYKSLYWAAVQRSEVRDELLDAARRESERAVRLGAIWALFAVHDSGARDVLRNIARRDDDEAVRVEALKSLYGLMRDSDVRDLAYDLARDPSTPAAVRRTAILLNSNRSTSTQVDLLETIVKYDRDPAMRAAAIIALGNPLSEELQTYFHLIRIDQNGVLVNDPLDME